MNTSKALAVLLLAAALWGGCDEPLRLSSNSDSDRVDTLMDRCRLNFYAGDFRYAESCLDSIFQNNKRLRPDQVARYYDLKAYLSYQMERPPAIIMAYADTIIRITTPQLESSPRMREYYTNGLFDKGEMYKNMGNYRLAYYYYLQAKKSGEKSGNGSGHATCINADFMYRLGMVLYSQEKYSDALRNFQASYADFVYCDSNITANFRKEELLSNIGLCYFKLKQYDSSLVYYDSATNFVKRYFTEDYSFHNIALGVISGNRAQVNYALGNVQQAINELTYNVKVNLERGHDISDAVTSIIHLAEIYADKKDLPQSFYWADLAQHIVDSVPDVFMQRKIYKLKWDYFARTQKFDSADVFARRFTYVNDSLTAKERKIQNADTQFTLEQLEKEFEYGLLMKDIENRKKLTALFITVSVLAVLLLIIILFSFYNVRKKNKQLELLNQDKDRIMGIVAHDLRNPISAVYTLNELILESLGDEQSERHEFSKVIKTACNSSLELINEILVMAEVSRDKSPVVTEPVDVNEFLSMAINLVAFRAEEKEQRIESDLLVISRIMHVDPEKFLRVINNLITNAIKFSPRGARILVSAEVQNEDLIICVKDEGIGIPIELQDKIFDPFTPAKRVGTSGEKPFGLGLSIVKKIVEAHNGRIWMESEEGKGATFFIKLSV